MGNLWPGAKSLECEENIKDKRWIFAVDSLVYLSI